MYLTSVNTAKIGKCIIAEIVIVGCMLQEVEYVVICYEAIPSILTLDVGGMLFRVFYKVPNGATGGLGLKSEGDFEGDTSTVTKAIRDEDNVDV